MDGYQHKLAFLTADVHQSSEELIVFLNDLFIPPEDIIRLYYLSSGFHGAFEFYFYSCVKILWRLSVGA